MDPRAYTDHAAFHVPDRLAAALRSSAAHGTPAYALLALERPIVEDLVSVPDDATFLATRGTARAVERIGEHARLTTLWAHPATNALVRQLPRLSQLRALYLGGTGRTDLSPIGDCSALQHLVLDGATALVDLSFLAGLPRLRTLYVHDARRLDLESLAPLPRLAALHLAGGPCTPLRIATLAPLSRLTLLRHLALENVRSADGLLRPLAALTRLRELHLPNSFDVDECARLAGALPHARGTVATPFYAESTAHAGTELFFRCDLCGRTRVLLTGRPTALLCPECDSAKVIRRVARWESVRGSAWPPAPEHGQP
ncbi:MAG TPA: hypothetical protein VMM18_18155 [Gemmatimonadaceae bacterium]|nr:hypothetical protein [Gemmatimonadaceae bacterium]